MRCLGLVPSSRLSLAKDFSMSGFLSGRVNGTQEAGNRVSIVFVTQRILINSICKNCFFASANGRIAMCDVLHVDAGLLAPLW